jgi:hypothetical protein
MGWSLQTLLIDHYHSLLAANSSARLIINLISAFVSCDDRFIDIQILYGFSMSLLYACCTGLLGPDFLARHTILIESSIIHMCFIWFNQACSSKYLVKVKISNFFFSKKKNLTCKPELIYKLFDKRTLICIDHRNLEQKKSALPRHAALLVTTWMHVLWCGDLESLSPWMRFASVQICRKLKQV